MPWLHDPTSEKEETKPNACRMGRRKRRKSKRRGRKRYTSDSGSFELQFDDFSFDDLSLLLDANPDRSPECLCQGLDLFFFFCEDDDGEEEERRGRGDLAHLERVDLARREGGKGCSRTERLRKTHRKCRLSRSRLAGEEDASSRDVALEDHLADDTERPARRVLSDETLGGVVCAETLVKTETTDVGVRAFFHQAVVVVVVVGFGSACKRRGKEGRGATNRSSRLV